MNKSVKKTKSPVLDELLRELAFCDEEVAEAARKQPILFNRASEYRIQKMRNRIAAENDYKLALTQAKVRVHQKYGRWGKRDRVDLEIETDPEVTRARDSLDRAKVEEEYAKLLLSSYRMRQSAISVAGGFHPRIGPRHVASDEEIEAMRRKLRKKFGRSKQKGKDDHG